MSILSRQLPIQPHLTAEKIQAANFFHLYWDVAWFGVAYGSTLSFLAIFATRLGATGWQVGLLSAGPALMNVFFTLPAGRWVAQRPLATAVTDSAVGQRLGLVLLMLFPVLLPTNFQIWATVALVLLMAVPGAALAIGFNALLATTVPIEWRGHVVGRRNVLLSAAIMLTFVASGWILDYFSFEWGYTIVFGIGALGGIMSTYHLFRIRVPAVPPKFEGRPLQDQAKPGRGIGFGAGAVAYRLVSPRLWLNWRPGGWHDFNHISTQYRWVMLAFFMFHFTQLLPAAIFPLFWVREAHLTDGQIGWINGVFYLSMLVGSLFLGRLTRRLGNYRLTAIGSILLAIYPLLIALSQGIGLLIFASALVGAIWAILSGAQINRLLELVPEDDRPAHMALYNLALNVAMLGGALLGPLMAEIVGIREALFIIVGLRLVSGLAVTRWS